MKNLIIGKTMTAANNTNENCPFKKIMTVEKDIFLFEKTNYSFIPYNPDTLLDENYYYFIDNFSKQSYCLDILMPRISSASYNDFTINDLGQLQFILVDNDKYSFLQKTTKSYISKKKFINLSHSFTLEDNPKVLIIKDEPDAIYDKVKDMLYFKKLENLTTVFIGIDLLYKEATQEETKNFINTKSINLTNNFSVKKVNKTNRKKITSINKYLEDFDEKNYPDLIGYIKSYCKQIPVKKNVFQIEDNKQLTQVLFGFQERYYTTEVRKKLNIANSIIKL